jgi:hypothetical protein
MMTGANMHLGSAGNRGRGGSPHAAFGHIGHASPPSLANALIHAVAQSVQYLWPASSKHSRAILTHEFLGSMHTGHIGPDSPSPIAENTMDTISDDMSCIEAVRAVMFMFRTMFGMSLPFLWIASNSSGVACQPRGCVMLLFATAITITGGRGCGSTAIAAAPGAPSSSRRLISNHARVARSIAISVALSSMFSLQNLCEHTAFHAAVMFVLASVVSAGSISGTSLS